MPVQGYYGTESNPYANLYSERIVLTPLTSDPSSLTEGDLWLRSDLTAGDKIATARFYDGSTTYDIPIFATGTSDSGISEVLRIDTPNGAGFIPLVQNGGSYSFLALQHNSNRYGWHNAATLIPDNGRIIREDASNPVITNGGTGDWDEAIAGRVAWVNDGGTYKVLYSGATSVTGVWQVGLATGSSPTSLSKSASNPVITNGAGGTWDDETVREGDLINDGDWVFGYVGSDGTTNKFGVARSTDSDFTTWTKDGSNPLLAPGDVSSISVDQFRGVSMLYDGSTYYLYINSKETADGSYQILGFTSSDLSTFSEMAGNPLIDYGPAAAWDSGIVGGCHVWRDGGEWHMLYDGHQGATNPVHSIGYATSTDGLSWSKDNISPVFSPNTLLNVDWDGGQAYQGSIIVEDGTWKMMYSGSPDEPSVDEQVGYAEFQSGTLNSLPSGSTVIEDWESPTAEAPYSGNNGVANVVATSPVANRRALRLTTNANAWVSATSGLNAFLSQDQTMSAWVRTGSDNATGPVVGYFQQSAGTFPQNGYYVDLSRSAGSMNVVMYNGGFNTLASPAVSYSDDTLYEVEINPTSGGTHNVTLYDETGTEIVSVAPSDSTYSSGGHAFGVASDGASARDSVHHDAAVIL